MSIIHNTGTNLKELAGFAGWYYDAVTSLPSYNLINRIIVFSAGTHIVTGTFFPSARLVNFNTGGDGLRTVYRIDPAMDGSGLAAGVTWATDQGTVTTGLAGENMCSYLPAGVAVEFCDPDSQVNSDSIGSTITVSGGTGFGSARTVGVDELLPAFDSVSNNVMEWISIGDALPSAGAYAGSWTLTHPAYKLSDAQALVPPVSSYTGSLTLGLIGDSVTAGLATRNRFLGYLTSTFPNAASIILDNLGSSGKKTSDWVPGQALYTSAVSTGNSHGWKVVNLCLGINDVNTGVSAATILANLRLIVDGLFADIPTLKKIVVQDIPSPNGSSTTTANTAISGIGHGATYTNAPFYGIVWANSVLAKDTLHPSQAGNHFLSLTWMIPLSTAIPAAEGPPVPDAPILTGVNAVSTGITMDIEAGASDGGSAIIDYEVWHKRDAAAYVLQATILAADITNPHLDPDTVQGEVVLIKVRCRSASGYSAFCTAVEVESQGPGHPDFTPSVHLYRGLSRALS